MGQHFDLKIVHRWSFKKEYLLLFKLLELRIKNKEKTEYKLGNYDTFRPP